MKKIKIMLLSLSLVAVVGGALAFKANYSTPYCTAQLPEDLNCQNIFCPDLVQSTTTSDVQIPSVCTANPGPNGCTGIQCAGSTRLKGE